MLCRRVQIDGAAAFCKSFVMARLGFRIYVISVVPTAMAVLACGGDVSSGTATALTATGGSSAVASLNSGGTASASGGSSASGVDAGMPPLPARCLVPFDPGYTCSSAAPLNYLIFDPTLGKCVTVEYNGCGGEAGGLFNAYNQLGQCEVLCERTPSDPNCPLTNGSGTGCSTDGAICSYSFSCLCVLGGAKGCLVTDPRCSSVAQAKSIGSAACTAELCSIQQPDIILPVLIVCVCGSGEWQCSDVYL